MQHKSATKKAAFYAFQIQFRRSQFRTCNSEIARDETATAIARRFHWKNCIKHLTIHLAICHLCNPTF